MGNSLNSSKNLPNIISPPAFLNKIQNLTLNNDDHSAISSNFSTNLNKPMLPPIKVKLHHKADWVFINSPLSKQLTILQEQILNFVSSDNADSINIINNAATIFTDAI